MRVGTMTEAEAMQVAILPNYKCFEFANFSSGLPHCAADAPHLLDSVS